MAMWVALSFHVVEVRGSDLDTKTSCSELFIFTPSHQSWAMMVPQTGFWLLASTFFPFPIPYSLIPLSEATLTADSLLI